MNAQKLAAELKQQLRSTGANRKACKVAGVLAQDLVVRNIANWFAFAGDR